MTYDEKLKQLNDTLEALQSYRAEETNANSVFTFEPRDTSTGEFI